MLVCSECAQEWEWFPFAAKERAPTPPVSNPCRRGPLSVQPWLGRSPRHVLWSSPVWLQAPGPIFSQHAPISLYPPLPPFPTSSPRQAGTWMCPSCEGPSARPPDTEPRPPSPTRREPLFSGMLPPMLGAMRHRSSFTARGAPMLGVGAVSTVSHVSPCFPLPLMRPVPAPTPAPRRNCGRHDAR